ncbi:hypothetical protein ISS85_05145, partial [Candidatus Microgenomates bacterium]|nr:hypothetical protein [Candidatus Microgenomates bacterium]
MPKKTKSQKIITDLKRKLATQQKEEVSLPQARQVNKRPSISTKAKSETPTILSSFIVKDLKKSLALTLLAISFEFVLYYVWEVRGI